MLVHMVFECSAVRLLLLHTLTCIGSFNVWLCIGCPLGCSTMCFYTGNNRCKCIEEWKITWPLYTCTYRKNHNHDCTAWSRYIYTVTLDCSFSYNYRFVSTLAKIFSTDSTVVSKSFFLHYTTCMQYALGEDWVAQLPDLPSLTMWYLKFHSRDTTGAYTILQNRHRSHDSTKRRRDQKQS